MADNRSSAPARPAEGTQSNPKVQWDDSGITNSYANVCNVSSSREEVVLVFGINKAWERGAKDVQVQLTNRLILSPFAAKRLAGLLNNVLQQYETRFGVLEPTAPHSGDKPATGSA